MAFKKRKKKLPVFYKIAPVFLAMAVFLGSGWIMTEDQPVAGKTKTQQTPEQKKIAEEVLEEVRNFDPGQRRMENLSREERRARMQNMRKRMDSLTDEQRQQVRKIMHNKFRERMRKDMAEFFTLSKEQQIAKLDERIDHMQERRPPPPEESGSNEEDSEEAKKREERRKHRHSRDVDERLSHFKNLLNDTTPEERAQFQAYMAAMHERMKERGITPRGPGRR